MLSCSSLAFCCYCVLSYANSGYCLIYHVGPWRTKQDNKGPSGTKGDHKEPYGIIWDHTWLFKAYGAVSNFLKANCRHTDRHMRFLEGHAPLKISLDLILVLVGNWDQASWLGQTFKYFVKLVLSSLSIRQS